MRLNETKQEKILNTEQVAKQIGGIRLSQLFESAENEFAKLIQEIENDPLFRKLMYPDSKNKKVINYKRFPCTELSRKFFEFNENIAVGNASFDIDSFLKKREEVVSIVERLGIDIFRQYFLYNEDGVSDEEIANGCKLAISDVQRIKDFVDDLAIHTEFYYPSTISAVNKIPYSKIASVEKKNSHSFVIGYFSPLLVRGRYSINHKKIEDMKREALFSKKELRRLNKLLRNLEFINRRKTTIYQVIQHIIKTQVEYLRAADETKVNFLTQKELARRINVHPSVICRIIKYRSIEMPWGQEKPLKYFFSSRKEEIQDLVRNIIKEEKDKLRKGLISQAYSDEKIRNILKTDYKINIARRTVREYRKQLGIPSATIRARNLK